MGGTIEVQSELGKGSAFTVTLALAEAQKTMSAGEAWSWETVLGYHGERRTILVVDDNADNRAVLRDFLLPLGFELFEADGGEAALRMAGLHRPALVLMDLSMAGMDGYEATRRLRQMPELQHVVLLASSASVGDAEQEKSLRAGCNDFLPKPVQANVLLDKIRDLLSVEWIFCENKALPAISSIYEKAEQRGALVLPSPEALAFLSNLALRGHVSMILREAKRMDRDDPRLGPWIEQFMIVAQSCQMRKLREFLKASIAGRTAL